MKNLIDKYFKNKLDIPQEPPSDAWDFIQNQIPKKEKRRFFPLWLQLSGIASLAIFIAGGIYVFKSFNSESGIHSNPVPSSAIVSGADSDDKSSEHRFQTEEHQSESEISDYNALKNTSGTSYSNQNHSIANNSNSIIYTTNNYEKNLTFFPSLNNHNNNQSDNDFSVSGLSHQDSQDLNSSDFTTPNNSLPTNPFSTPLLDKLEEENKELIAMTTKATKKKNSKKDLKKKIEFDRFYISGFVSPMALNTFVGNSMLSDEMSQYKTENNVTLAYGVKGAYALNPRVKIRTGVSVVGFEQVTKNVPLTANVGSGFSSAIVDSKNNVKYSGSLRIENNNYASSLINTELNNKSFNGDIQQQSQYIEIPVEAEVALFQTNSIGISATAGGSTWLLSKNKIYAHTDEYTEELGKADNLNNTSFSANAGLKFDMKISEKVQVNVEPAFKYLFNPVNDIEKYNPYTVGVNAGVTVSLK
ncbi:hypothetical protein [Moheibacter sp.]|uniref:hypothetical protein n=1 Tax=Moheibacter sp. TaxID=1965316 RepID=UPI003C740FBA